MAQNVRIEQGMFATLLAGHGHAFASETPSFTAGKEHCASQWLKHNECISRTVHLLKPRKNLSVPAQPLLHHAVAIIR